MNPHELKNAFEKIEMPEETKERLIRNCHAAESDTQKSAPIIPRKVLGMACVFSFAILVGIGVWRSGVLNTPPSDPIISDSPVGNGNQTPNDPNSIPNISPTTSQVDDPSDPTVTDPPIPSEIHSDDPSNLGGDEPSGETPGGDRSSGGDSGNDVPGGDTPGSVYQENIAQNYQEAKALFGHPILECFDSRFVNYTLGMVSQKNGDWSPVFLNYNFTNGQIVLMDGDRFLAGSFGIDNDGRIEYQDRVFWIDTHLSNDNQSVIVNYPETVNEAYGVGIGYEAIFDKSVEQTEIMDLIISLEIK